MNSLHIPFEIWDSILEHLVPDNWNDGTQPAHLELRFVCGLFDKIISYYSFQKLDHERLLENAFEMRDPVVRWLLINKIRAQDDIRDGFVGAVNNTVFATAHWNECNSKPRLDDELLQSACGAVVASQGSLWVCDQLGFLGGSHELSLNEAEPSSPQPMSLEEQRQQALNSMTQFECFQLAAYNGDLPLVETFLNKGVDPDQSGCFFGYALYLAAARGHTNIVRLLIEKGANVTAKGAKGTPIEGAAYDGRLETVQFLWDKIDEAYAIGVGRRCLLGAARHGHESVVRFLLAQPGIDVNTRSVIRQTPLILAGQEKHKSLVKMLLERDDIQPDLQDDSGTTILLWASKRGWLDIVEMLLARDDVHPRATNTHLCDSPLAAAVSKGYEEIVKALLRRWDFSAEFGHDRLDPLYRAILADNVSMLKLLLPTVVVPLNHYSIGGNGLFYVAVDAGSPSVLRYFLSRDDIDPNRSSLDGFTPLYTASLRCQGEIVKLLLENEKVNPNPEIHPLLSAALNRNAEAVRLLLQYDRVDPNQPVHCGALYVAVSSGNMEIIKLLLQRHDIDVNQRGLDRRPVLWEAVRHDHQSIVRLLLSREDLDPNMIYKNDKTALHLAAAEGKETLARMILARKDIDPNMGGTEGTPLFQAAKFGHEGIVSALLERTDVDPNKSPEISDGHTYILHRGVEPLNPYSFIRSKGPSGGKSPLAIAALFGHLRTARLLLEHPNIQPNIRDSVGRTALWLAVSRDNSEIVQAILQHPQTDPALCDNQGWSPLSVAANQAYEIVVELLLQHEGTDPNSRNEDQLSALMIAAKFGRATITDQLLLHPDLDTEMTTPDGKTALMLARERNLDAVVRLLEQHARSRS